MPTPPATQSITDRMGSTAMALTALAMYGNFYVYDSIAPVAEMLSSKLVEAGRFGTAIGVMWVLQNAAIAGSNMVAGWLNDVNAAGAANPDGYGPMMVFFLACSSFGFFATLVLWRLVPGRIGK